MTDLLRLVGVTKDAQTAGPGKRFEIFTKGCIRGVVNPCEGCFNEDTWTFEGKYRHMPVKELSDIILRDAWNRQVTFCGGEPVLQAVALTKVAQKLKEIDDSFHIIMYTAYKLDTLMKHGLKFTWVKEKHGQGMYDQLFETCVDARFKESDKDDNPLIVEFIILTPYDVMNLMKYVDVIVDGDYKHEQRIPISKHMDNGMFVGSDNQRIIDCKESLRLNEIVYEVPSEWNSYQQSVQACRCCGHEISKGRVFCDETCYRRYSDRQQEMKMFGGTTNAHLKS